MLQRLVRDNLLLKGLLGLLIGSGMVVASALLSRRRASEVALNLLDQVGLALLITVLGVGTLLLGGWEKIKQYLEEQIRRQQLAELRSIEQQVRHLHTTNARALADLADRLDRIEQIETEVGRRNTNAEALNRAGVLKVFAHRAEAYPDMIRLVRDPTTTVIRIAGVRLSDLVRGRSATGPWAAVLQAMREKAAADGGGGLEVRVLLLDPFSNGARLLTHRDASHPHHVSNQNRERATELTRQIELTAHRLANLGDDLRSDAGVNLSVRFYRTAPHSFVFATNSTVFTQQYTLEHVVQRNPTPMVRYGGGSSGHLAVIHHFDILWANSVSRADLLDASSIGIEQAVWHSDIVNMFTDPQIANARMNWLIDNARERVWIQGISLNPMFMPPLDAAMNRLARRVGEGVDVRLLILDPDCEQAYFKTYRDCGTTFPSFPDYVRGGGSRHHESQFCREISESMSRFQSFIRNGAQHFDLRIYRSAPQAYVLIVDDRALIEQYHYGKTSDEISQIQLRLTQLPLVEVRKSDGIRRPYDVICDHYNYVFTELAVPAPPT